MEYKGFTGSIEKNDDGTGYHGNILNINHLFSYEGVDHRDLYECFKDAVDDYLKTTQEELALFSLPVYTPAESLTKENFWNKLYADYPDGMKVFCDWIDEYKKAVDWDELFNDSYEMGITPKYHDLPFAMQIGIWIAFLTWIDEQKQFEGIGLMSFPVDLKAQSWKEDIENTIAELQCIKDRDNEL